MSLLELYLGKNMTLNLSLDSQDSSRLDKLKHDLNSLENLIKGTIQTKDVTNLTGVIKRIASQRDSIGTEQQDIFKAHLEKFASSNPELYKLVLQSLKNDSTACQILTQINPYSPLKASSSATPSSASEEGPVTPVVTPATPATPATSGFSRFVSSLLAGVSTLVSFEEYKSVTASREVVLTHLVSGIPIFVTNSL
ncbi:unnamed protein product [Rotaria magnacalcarata]